MNIRESNKEPSGEYLLSLLIELLADQEGVKITYEIETERKGEGNE